MKKSLSEMSGYINIDLYNKVEATHPYYQEMLQEVINQIKLNTKKDDQKTHILEMGAGTGIATEKLAQIPRVMIDALEIDTICCEYLNKKTGSNVNIIQGDAVTYRQAKQYDLVVSIFSHDHIPYKKSHRFVKNIAANLKNSGKYILGCEFLPVFENETQRKRSLHLYHNFIIQKAKEEGHHHLAALEKEALVSGLKKIGDFKRHIKMFEEEMKLGGFKINFKGKIGPKNNTRRGGIYVYTFELP